MIKNFALNCISDEINHPIITNSYRITLSVVILTSILLTLLDNQISIHIKYEQPIYYFQTLLFFLLVVDFLLRIIGSISHYDMENHDEHIHYNSLTGYLFSYYGFIDFMSTIPFIINILNLDYIDIKTVFSMIIILKMARFSPALIVLKDVIISERKSLFAALYLMMILTFSLSTILYFVERNVNPEGFGTLLDAIWWAIVTLATVGYGDVVPHTQLGKLLGGIAAITGFGMFALPAGILASGFAEEIKRLRNITNWNMVAKVPLFSDFEFGVIADISKLLHVKRFRKNELIIKEGSSGNSMYFILEGNVFVDKKDLHVVLNSGDFFGEISLIKNIPRTATVTAKSRCELLELTTYDFQNLISTKPELLKKIEDVASSRHQD